MFIEMACGCGASFQADSTDNDTLIMLWANAFISSHQECGFMSLPKQSEQHEKEL